MYEKIEEFFERHGISPKKQNGRSYIFDCPVCGAGDKLYIEKSNGRSICFRHKTEECPTAKTSIAKVLSLVSGLPFDQVKQELSDKITTNQYEVLEEVQDLRIDKSVKQISLPLKELTESSEFPPDLRPIKDISSMEGGVYLHSRGLDIDQLESLGVCYSPYMRRVVFPVIQHGKIYGWQARTIDKGVEPRMYNLPGEWKTKTLMFHDNLLNSPHAIIAEGAVSALKFKLVGGYVATMGKAVSRGQLDLILKSGVKRVYVALDPDAVLEIEELVKKILYATNNSVQCFLVRVPEGREDFGDCTYEECKKAIEEADMLDSQCYALYNYMTEKA